MGTSVVRVQCCLPWTGAHNALLILINGNLETASPLPD